MLVKSTVYTEAVAGDAEAEAGVGLSANIMSANELMRC